MQTSTDDTSARDPCLSIRFTASRKENATHAVEDFLDLDAVVSGSEDQSDDTEEDDEEHMLKELELFIDDSESIPSVCCIHAFLFLILSWQQAGRFGEYDGDIPIVAKRTVHTSDVHS